MGVKGTVLDYAVINDCWVVVGKYCDKDGYPALRVNKKFWRASRLAYTIFKGSIPKNKIVRHSCDNRECINPEHLILGSHKDNVIDRVKKNRCARCESNGRSKLKKNKVIKIFGDKKTKKTILAKRYGVTRKVIYDIQQQNTWRSVTT